MVNVLVLCSGSVAAIKVPELLDRLGQRPDTRWLKIISSMVTKMSPASGWC